MDMDIALINYFICFPRNSLLIHYNLGKINFIMGFLTRLFFSLILSLFTSFIFFNPYFTSFQLSARSPTHLLTSVL